MDQIDFAAMQALPLSTTRRRRNAKEGTYVPDHTQPPQPVAVVLYIALYRTVR